jgi:hypothetical protein
MFGRKAVLKCPDATSDGIGDPPGEMAVMYGCPGHIGSAMKVEHVLLGARLLRRDAVKREPAGLNLFGSAARWWVWHKLLDGAHVAAPPLDIEMPAAALEKNANAQPQQFRAQAHRLFSRA